MRKRRFTTTPRAATDDFLPLRARVAAPTMVFRPEGRTGAGHCMQKSRVWVYVALLIAVSGVVIHIGAVFAGDAWFVFFNAPPSVVASARAGTWLAPLSASVIALLMALCAVYAASALGWVRRPPLQRIGLAGIAVVCLLRALILPVLSIGHPELRNMFEVISALVWGTAGIGFAVGFRLARAGHGNPAGRCAAGPITMSCVSSD